MNSEKKLVWRAATGATREAAARLDAIVTEQDGSAWQQTGIVTACS